MAKRIYTKHTSEIGESVADFVRSKIYSGNSDMFGDREDHHIESQLERTQYAIGKLSEILLERGLITVTDMLSIVNIGEWETKQQKIEVREEQ